MITADLDGLWRPAWQLFRLDDKHALSRGLTTTSLKDHDRERAAPHGTYVPVQFFRVQTADSDDGKVENQIIVIYDARANFIRFLWDESAGLWKSSNEPIVYRIPAGTYGYNKTKIPELTLTRYPTLALTAYTKDDAPDDSYVGEYYPYPVSLDARARAMDLPEQTLEYKGDEKHLLWQIGPVKEDRTLALLRGLPPLDPNRTTDGHHLSHKFGDLFVPSDLDQVSNSFCGFNPANEAASYTNKDGLYTATGLGTLPGDTSTQNPNQSFQGALLFGFPRYDSYDYVQCTYFGHGPNVPKGIWPEPLYTEDAATHTEFVSSTTDEANAFAMSLGLSAGIEKVLSVKGSFAYSGKTETQRKNQSRYTVSRKVAKAWAAHLDIPSLALHETYLGGIKTRTYALLSDPTPDKSQTPGWEHDFVRTWGTHYANSITHGSITLAKTWFSLKAEEQASEHNVKIKTSASGTLEGVTAGADVSVETGWKDKKVNEVSSEDTEHFGIGAPDKPITIFLDLRPASELMSPIFVPHNEKDEWGKFAPWVWTEVRSDFEEWLTAQGLNQPLDPAFVEDYRPRRFTITLKSLHFIHVGKIDHAQGNGVVTILPQVSEKSTQIDVSQQIISKTPGLDFRMPSNGNFWAPLEIEGQDALQPGTKNAIGCTIATTAGNLKAGEKGGICFALDADLWLSKGVMKQVARKGPHGMSGWDSVEERVNHGVWTVRGMVVEIPSGDLPKVKGQEVTKVVRVEPTQRPSSGAAEAVWLTFGVSSGVPFQD
jgi:hypothetical protein